MKHKDIYYITGATCDIGIEIVNKLLLKQKTVYVLVRDIKKAKQVFRNSKISYISFDLHRKIENYKIRKNSTLIHCAWEKPRDVQNNIHIDSVLKYHYHFISKMISMGIKKVIVTGTCSEFGMTYGPVKSTTETNPCTSYGIGKDYLHKSLRILENDQDYDLIWLRLFNVYEESVNKRTVTSLLCKAIDDNDAEFSMSFGDQKFDYMRVKDVAEKIIKSIDKESGTYHICSAKPIKLKKLLESIKKERNSNIKLKLGEYPYRDHEPFAIWGANDDIK